jgi:hypothetical protein
VELPLIALLGIASAPLIQATDRKGAASNHEAYDDGEIAKAASDFFSTGAKETVRCARKGAERKGPTDRLYPWRGVRRGPRFAVRLG